MMPVTRNADGNGNCCGAPAAIKQVSITLRRYWEIATCSTHAILNATIRLNAKIGTRFSIGGLWDRP